MAVFNFPLRREHAGRAVALARSGVCRLTHSAGAPAGDLGVGYGPPPGLSFGEFGRSHRDLTAIGTVVNIASRVQSVAAAGEILATQAVVDHARSEIAGSRSSTHNLKGLDAPMTLYII